MLDKINNMVWGNGLVFLLMLTGVVYTIKLKGVQLRLLPNIFKGMSNKENKCKYVRTMCMSLGTAMGTGNITGVASAIAIGGAGAVFWMWVSAFLGMATVYAENKLSERYSDDDMKGPIAYITKGLGSRRLAAVFAFCCILASFGMGGMAQISTMSNSINCYTNVNRYILALIIFTVIFAVITGGSERIGKAAQILLPAATIAYSAVCIILIFTNRHSLPSVMRDIFYEAFGFQQALGGIVGHAVTKALSVGTRRGVFSNEAGLGSSPLIHSSDDTGSYAVCAMFEVFIDTIICCTLTALTILCCSSDLTLRNSFSTLLGAKTNIFLAFIMTIFAFCTVIGWYFCGETAFSYLFPDSSAKKYAFAFALTASIGAIIRADTIWTLSDIFNGIMAFPNILALLFLITKVDKE